MSAHPIHYARAPKGQPPSALCGLPVALEWTRDVMLASCPRCLVRLEQVLRLEGTLVRFAEETFGMLV